MKARKKKTPTWPYKLTPEQALAHGCSQYSFIAVDPGRDGGTVVYRGGELVEASCQADDPLILELLCEEYGIDTLIFEGQYVGVNAKSAVTLSWLCGIYAGLAMGGERRMYVEIMPGAWQKHQRLQNGITTGLKRDAGIELGIACALPRLEELDGWKQPNKKRTEGICSAVGIADCWAAWK